MATSFPLKELTMWLTDQLCDENVEWRERHKYFPEWLRYIRMWKEFDKHKKYVYH